MAVRAAAANGNLTSAATWGLIDATTFLNSESANTALTTSFVESSTSTPGVVTPDGVFVKIASRAASPTGTMTVHLAIAGVEVVGSAVTVNVSDLPTCTATSGTTTPVGTAEGGWFFFKFSSPLTLLGATLYSVGAKTSSASQVNLWSSATTNWSRALRTTTTGAPTAADDLIIAGEWTAAGTMTARSVTMDSTAATAYGSNTTTQVTPATSICKGGTLAFGLAASTAYVFQQSGYIVVYNGGTLSLGSSGSEMPRNSSGVLQFNCASDGDFGVVARNGATVNMAGLSRTSGNNTVITKLAADAAAGATALTTSAATGWLNGDLVCYAPTGQTSTQFESKALTADAVSTALTSTALTNAHSGTSPTQAEVGLLTRNVVMKAVTANVVTFFYVATTAIVSLSFAQFRYLSTNATGKIGFNINTTTGSFAMDRCSVHDSDSAWFYMTGAGFSNITVTNTVFYNFGVSNSGNNGGLTAASTTTGSWTIDNCMLCGSATANFNMVQLADVGGTFTNNSVSGNASGTTSTAGIMLTEQDATMGTFSGLSVHANQSDGLQVNVRMNGQISSSSFWRNTSYGIYMNAGQTTAGVFTLSAVDMFGNATAGITSPTNVTLVLNWILLNCTMNGDTTFTQTNGIFLGPSGGNIVLWSCNFSTVSGIKTKCSNDWNFNSSASMLSIIANNCIFNGTNVYTAAAGMIQTIPLLQCQNFGQVANDNRTFVPNGTSVMGLIQTNTSTVFGTNIRSEQMSPGSAALKLQSASVLVATPSGKVATPIVQVQKNAGYAGNAARLILKRQDSMGITSDQVIATFSAGSGSWQALSGASPSAPQDGVFEFIVDCDGTAGSVFLGDASATVA